MGFIGAIDWFLPEELGREPEGITLAEWLFWVLCAAIAVLIGVFIFVQNSSANEWSMWFINQGRKYLEAPRWAAIGIAVVACVFACDAIATTIAARRSTGILTGLIAALVPLVVLYLDAFPRGREHAQGSLLVVVARAPVGRGDVGGADRMHHGVDADPYRWCVAARGRELALGQSGARARHRYPRPRSSLFLDRHAPLLVAIGPFFSALEPLPLLGMVVHAVYDAGEPHLQAANRRAFFWTLAEAFGNFVGAGVWWFMSARACGGS